MSRAAWFSTPGLTRPQGNPAGSVHDGSKRRRVLHRSDESRHRDGVAPMSQAFTDDGTSVIPVYASAT
jgi:hypothetical protein